MSENYIVINGKRAELTKEQMEQLGIEEKKKDKRWRADQGEKYYFVGIVGEVFNTCERNDAFSIFRYYSHNYFRTREEAEIYARVLETEMLLKRYADEHNGKFGDCKYELYIDKIDSDSVLVSLVWGSYIFSRTVWFSSENVALEAINEIGKDRILEYLAYEW